MEQQLIHPQTYTLLKGKQPPSYYSTEEKMLERGREIIEGVAKFFNYTCLLYTSPSPRDV